MMEKNDRNIRKNDEMLEKFPQDSGPGMVNAGCMDKLDCIRLVNKSRESFPKNLTRQPQRLF